MPAAWVGAAVGVANLLGGSSGGGGSGSTGQTKSGYVPTNLDGEDTNWQNAISGGQNVVSTTANMTQPLYNQSYYNSSNINYSPYQQGANRAGAEYGQLAGLSNQQAGIYGQQAGLAGQQQQNLYGGANSIMQRAFDPNNAQFMQSQQQLTDQVNAGQAARGLGNSPIGGMEYNNAMSNFDVNWNTRKLQNEALGSQAASGLSNAGGQQGQLVGANLAAQQGAGSNAAGYYQQAGQVPITAQQYIANQPAATANAYQGEMGNLQSMYGNLGNQASAYLNAGIAPSQNQAQYAQSQLNGGLSAIGGLANSANTPGSWLNNMFSSNNSSPGAYNGQNVNPIGGNSFGGSYGGAGDGSPPVNIAYGGT